MKGCGPKLPKRLGNPPWHAAGLNKRCIDSATPCRLCCFACSLFCCHSRRSAASFAAVADAAAAAAAAPTAVAARRCFAVDVDVAVAAAAAALDILQHFVLLSNFVEQKWRQTWRPFLSCLSCSCCWRCRCCRRPGNS